MSKACKTGEILTDFLGLKNLPTCGLLYYVFKPCIRDLLFGKKITV